MLKVTKLVANLENFQFCKSLQNIWKSSGQSDNINTKEYKSASS